MSRKRRRDVSPEIERDAPRPIPRVTTLSLSQKLKQQVYDDIKRRHTGAFEKRTVTDFVNRLGIRQASATKVAREGSQKVKSALRDRRFYHPKKDFVGATITGREATIFGGQKLEHYAKDSATICEQRETRRQVLFATGKGGRAHRTPHRWTEHSNRSCR